MRHHRAIDEIPGDAGPHAIAIGTFDGVHLGHQEVIGLAVAAAKRLDMASMVVTFDPNPLEVLHPSLKTTVLTTSGLRAALLERAGVDALLEIPFTEEFSRIEWEPFCEMLIQPPISARFVSVGRNFRFGHDGAGTAKMLREFAADHGVEVEIPNLVTSPDGKPISSTRIRRLIAQGDVDEATSLLGRPHILKGLVVEGDGRGTGLGIPTANVEVADHMAVPLNGVYAAKCRVGDRWYAAAVNIGHAPTFRSGPEVRLEAFLLDYDGDDLYGQRVSVAFLRRLRSERRFANAEALITQIRRDVEQATGVAAGASDPL